MSPATERFRSAEKHRHEEQPGPVPMCDAFGAQTNVRCSGIIEVDGLPTRPKLKNSTHIQPEDASATATPDEQDHNREFGAHFKNDQAFALAAASLR
jgi:chemotaxis protein MotB